MPLRVTAKIEIPDEDLRFTFKQVIERWLIREWRNLDTQQARVLLVLHHPSAVLGHRLAALTYVYNRLQ